MAQLSEALLASMRSCPYWDGSGVIHLVPNWKPLQEAALAAPCESGLYALGIWRGIRYDGGISRIVYIGSSNSLQRRLAQHKLSPHNYEIAELLRVYTEGLWAASWPIPLVERDWLYGVEGEALCVFERAFGTVPVANTGIPDVPFAIDCRGLVRIDSCTDAPDPVPLDQLADRLPSVRVRKRFRPGGCGPIVSANAVFYHEALPPTAEEIAVRAEQHERERLATIWDENIATWSVEKMQGIMQVCSELRALKVAEGSRVRRFEAARADVPIPHTWGEVAVVQGRIIAGSWNPAGKLWVKVVHGRELLGQAFLEHWGCRGEDCRPLPQVDHPRPSYWELDQPNTSVATGTLDENVRLEQQRLMDTIEKTFLQATERL